MAHPDHAIAIFQQLLQMPLEDALEIMEQKNRNCLVMGPMSLIVGCIGEYTVGVMFERGHPEPPTWFLLYSGKVKKIVSKVVGGFKMELVCDESVELLHNGNPWDKTIKGQTLTIVVTPHIISW